jgi:rRNA maturation protein Nop10
MKLKKCPSCKTYTLKDTCPNPGCDDKKTKSAHYKHIKIKSFQNSGSVSKE